MRKEEKITSVTRKKRKRGLFRKRAYTGFVLVLLLVPTLFYIKYNSSSAQSLHHKKSYLDIQVYSSNFKTNLSEVSNPTNIYNKSDNKSDPSDSTFNIDNESASSSTVINEANDTTVELNEKDTHSEETSVELDGNATNVKDTGIELDTSKENVTEDESSKNEKDIPTVEEFFEDTIFIGDSRTVDLGKFVDMGNARFYAYQGLSVRTAMQREYITLDNKQKGNVIDAAKQHSFKRVYIMFGINELGWKSLDIFIDEYKTILEELRKLQPNASIYIQANYPVTERISSSDKVYNNENIQKFNKEIKKMANEEHAFYIDLYKYFEDEKGALPEEASSDGIHLNPKYYEVWKKCLLDFGYGFEC